MRSLQQMYKKNIDNSQPETFKRMEPLSLFGGQSRSGAFAPLPQWLLP